MMPNLQDTPKSKTGDYILRITKSRLMGHKAIPILGNPYIVCKLTHWPRNLEDITIGGESTKPMAATFLNQYNFQLCSKYINLTNKSSSYSYV